ncbi:MAG: glycosyltransferase, partial [Thermoleophilia bacterium]|nr:glycosyltransferase [Thermoleophilia bacterium]
VREQGEAYREGLERLAHDLGVGPNVVFFNRFAELDELTEFLKATDVYVTPYLNAAQITSGTLAYAFGSGKAVVSTPYWHAEELLADGRGAIVPFGDSAAIAGEVLTLLRDEGHRDAIRTRAYELGRTMIWSESARHYVEAFQRAREERSESTARAATAPVAAEAPVRLPAFRLDHLRNLTDGTGLIQHACHTLPNYDEGYCTDDNARGLLLTVMLEALGRDDPTVAALATRYAAFVNAAFDPARGRFRNFMGFDRRWLEDVGSEDSHGRAIWALGACVGRSKRGDFPYWAVPLFEQALPKVMDMASPRSWAFALLGIHDYSRRLAGDRRATRARDTLVARLLDLH